MLIQYGSQLHYQCAFDLVPKVDPAPGWDDIIKAIRKWVSKKCGQHDELGRKWFFTGGDWRPQDRRGFRVQTASFIATGSETAPDYWALRYQHPCDDNSFRQWQADIGVSVIDADRYRFVCTITHMLLPGYIGPEPPSPVPSAPGIVTTLLHAVRWSAMTGTNPLTTQPVPLVAGDGRDFLDNLIAHPRLPIVLVSLDYGSHAPKLDPAELSGLLAGTAVVYAAQSSEVDKELEWLLPKHLRCWNGMVRIYQSGADQANEFDGRRHRFFLGTDIDTQTPAVVRDIIIRGVVRRGRVWIGDGVATIEDVIRRRRETRLKELRAQTDGQPSREWIELLEDDNAALNTQLQQVNRIKDELETKNADYDDQIATLEYENRASEQRAADAERRNRDLTIQVQAVNTLSALPDTIIGVIEVLERLHAGRIVFTDRAKKAAKQSDFTDINAAWSCIWSMATVLHRLHFDSQADSATIEREFRAQSGFAVSLTEGKETKADKKLMAIRKSVWQNTDIDITPHVKCDKKKKHLRIHYCPLKDRSLLVVDHCGEHLDTSGTRKRN